MTGIAIDDGTKYFVTVFFFVFVENKEKITIYPIEFRGETSIWSSNRWNDIKRL